MVIVITLTVLQFRFVEKRVNYTNDAPMVERSPALTFLAHAVLVLGVPIVALPGLRDLRRVDPHGAGDCAAMPLLPGSHLWETYSNALIGGGRARRRLPRWRT